MSQSHVFVILYANCCTNCYPRDIFEKMTSLSPIPYLPVFPHRVLFLLLSSYGSLFHVRMRSTTTRWPCCKLPYV